MGNVHKAACKCTSCYCYNVLCPEENVIIQIWSYLGVGYSKIQYSSVQKKKSQITIKMEKALASMVKYLSPILSIMHNTLTSWKRSKSYHIHINRVNYVIKQNVSHNKKKKAGSYFWNDIKIKNFKKSLSIWRNKFTLYNTI